MTGGQKKLETLEKAGIIVQGVSPVPSWLFQSELNLENPQVEGCALIIEH